jgi:hypothetical protein
MTQVCSRISGSPLHQMARGLLDRSGLVLISRTKTKANKAVSIFVGLTYQIVRYQHFYCRRFQ